MISRNMRGKTITVPAKKKAIVSLKSGKIDIFEDKGSSDKSVKKTK